MSDATNARGQAAVTDSMIALGPPARRLLAVASTIVIVAGLMMSASPVATSAAAPSAVKDSDHDGLTDWFERNRSRTDPTNPDSDRDGVIDSVEDHDGDRLGNLGEQRFKTHPRRRDSDRDGIPDGREDHDRDGVSNADQQDRRPLPAELTPALAEARDDWPGKPTNCYPVGVDPAVRRCVFGDTSSSTTVAIFGDSHVLQWVPALHRAGSIMHWRIVTLVRRSCPSAAVLNRPQFNLDGGASCGEWRQNAIRWLRDHPPALIVISNSQRIKLHGADSRGEERRRWRRGLTRTLRALPRRSKVLIIADAPSNTHNPITCLLEHENDISACVSKRQRPAQRKYHLVERNVARLMGADFRTLHNKICSYDPCPLVHGNALIWRDGGHLTATISRRLTPSLRSMVRVALR